MGGCDGAGCETHVGGGGLNLANKQTHVPSCREGHGSAILRAEPQPFPQDSIKDHAGVCLKQPQASGESKRP